MIAFRASDRTRYALKLIASAHGFGSVTDAIHFAINQALANPELGVYEQAKRTPTSLERVVHMTWDDDEVVRFENLRKMFPRLLGPDERQLQRVIEAEEIKKGRELDSPEIRERWAEFVEAAERL